jgi:hypothetical protein
LKRVLLLVLLAGCARPLPIEEKPENLNFSSSQTTSWIGGQPAIVLKQEESGEAREPHFSSATVLPGRGMNLFDLRAHFRSGSEVSIFETASLEALEVTDNKGAAILRDDQILSGKMDRVEVASAGDHARATGVVEQEGVLIALTGMLKKRTFALTLIAKNQGKEPRKIRVGWNPHFAARSRLRSISAESVEVVSAEGSYGIRIKNFSPESPSFEVSRPGTARNQPLNPRIAIKPVTVKPGESVTYSAEIELIKP